MPRWSHVKPSASHERHSGRVSNRTSTSTLHTKLDFCAKSNSEGQELAQRDKRMHGMRETTKSTCDSESTLPTLLDYRDLAKLTKESVATHRRRQKNGTGPRALRLSGRHVRFDRADVIRWMQSCAVEASQGDCVHHTFSEPSANLQQQGDPKETPETQLRDEALSYETTESGV